MSGMRGSQGSSPHRPGDAMSSAHRFREVVQVDVVEVQQVVAGEPTNARHRDEFSVPAHRAHSWLHHRPGELEGVPRLLAGPGSLPVLVFSPCRRV